VPPSQLYSLFGGDCDFEYDHKTFWPAYLALAHERRERYFRNWKALGGGIGLSEWIYGGVEGGGGGGVRLGEGG